MKKVMKDLKKFMAFCLAAAMLLSVCTAFADDADPCADSGLVQYWNIASQDAGPEESVNVFGAANMKANVSANQQSSDGSYFYDKTKTCYGAVYTANNSGKTKVAEGQWLIIDVNLATDNSDAKIQPRAGQDVSTLSGYSITPNRWHSVRLAVYSPDGTKTATEENNKQISFSEHKIYVDGKEIGHYNPSDSNVNKMEYRANNPDSEKYWYIRLTKATGADKYSTNYAADLRLSAKYVESNDSADFSFELPVLKETDLYGVAGDFVHPNDKNGLSITDITYTDGTVTATRKNSDGTESAVDGALQTGDTILVKDKDNFVNTYTYTDEKNIIFEGKTFDEINVLGKTRATASSVAGQYGKEQNDTGLEITNNDNSNAGYIYDEIIGTKAIGEKYTVFEMNIIPTSDLNQFYYQTTSAQTLTPRIYTNNKNLKTDCWNKVVIVMEKAKNAEYKNSDGTIEYRHRADVYINGIQQENVSPMPALFNEPARGGNTALATAIRLTMEMKKDNGVYRTGKAATVDDIKIYETYTYPEIGAYTLTNTADAAYDSSSNTFYAKSNDAIAAACGDGAKVALSGEGYVIINRGDENYSRYNVRIIENGKIGIDTAKKEFWGTAAELTENDKLVAAKYENGKLSGIEILDGKKIGSNVLMAGYSVESGKTTKLYFWNMNTLKPLGEAIKVEAAAAAE